MTFYPKQGTFSVEEFNSSTDAIFQNPTLQNITEGGYVSLLSTQTGVFNLVRAWVPVLNWTLSNNLYNLQTLTGDFGVVTGVVSGQTNRITGQFGISSEATAWLIDTSTAYPPYISGFGYSGAGSYFFYLASGTPDQSLFYSIVSGSQATTFEFDVASYAEYSGLGILSGFNQGQNNETGLAPLTGLVGHGLLYSNGVNWDFLEVTPYGIRSLNHPEIAIPEDFLSPRRVRVGFRGTDLYISLQDGRSIAAFGKFDTPVYSSNQIFAAFGSVTSGSVLSTSGNKVMNSVKASYGRTLWDNIKVLTGELAIYSQANESFYTTGYATMYTSEFNPGVAITSYLNAYIKYLPYKGGTTEVSAQYSGAAGWVDYSTTSLTGEGYTSLDLSTFPVYTYPRENLGTDYFVNPIRFKIRQRSLQGNSLPPPVDSIAVFANKERLYIDLVPDWKTRDSYVTVKAAIQTGTFLGDDPVPERWSSFLVNTPYNTGVAVGNAFTDEAKNLNITVVGTGEFVLEGPYRSCFKNYTEGQLTALSGSEAFSYFGSAPTYNAFPNPLFENGFREIGTGESNYYTGLTEGELAESVRISSIYTGDFKVDYIKERTYRPEAQARVAKINSYLGNSATQLEEFVQTIDVYESSGTHNGRVGIEAVVPSGIASGNLLVSFDIQIAQGSGISLSCIGSLTGNYILPGDYFRNYSTITLATNSSNSSSYILRFNVPSGYNADHYRYSIDNIIVGSYKDSYLRLTGVLPYLHSSGIPTDYVVSGDQKIPDRASTIFYGNIYLDSYPVTTGTLLEITGASGRGLKLQINNAGRLISTFDLAHSSWAEYYNSTDTYLLPKETLISEQIVPIGKWTNIAFYHDTHTYRKYSFGSIQAAEQLARNFASTNKAYLCLDGYPVASKDLMSGWRDASAILPTITELGEDSNPFLTYLNITGNCTAVIASGLMCKLDGFHLLRPPVGELEAEITVKGARSYVPYFVPDFLYKGNNEDSNILYAGPEDPIHGKDLYIGSCYNFSSPGFVNFDRGPIRNHLLIYGTPYKELSNPYNIDNINSTRFSGSFAIAPYSSSYERLQTRYSNLGIPVLSGFGDGSIQAFGWVYPRTTGSFFTAYQNYSTTAGSRIEACISTGNKFIINKYGSTDSLLFTVTGHDVTLDDWNFLSFRFKSTGYFANLNTGAVTCSISDGSNLTSSFIRTGVDFGFIYQGLSGSAGQSAIKFGGSSDCSLFNWVLPIVYTGDLDITRNYITDGDKSGRYQAILEEQKLFTGRAITPNYTTIKFEVGPSEPKNVYYSTSLLNSYDCIPPLNGMNAYDNKPFKVINTYSLNYDLSKFESVFGAVDSPIRIGNTVPANGVNIAKFSSPEYSADSSISSIDLSDLNSNNLNVYRQGAYLVGSRSVSSTSEIRSFNGTNSGLYSGRIDVTISGQVVSSDVDLSTISISNSNSDFGYLAYYYYLIGRGDRGVKVAGANLHYTGQLSEFSTGTIPDNYIANLEKIKNSISLKDRNGNLVPFDSYPYDIAISPYSPDVLQIAALSGLNVGLDNVGTYLSGRVLPNGVFTVLLLTTRNTLDGESVFVHYNGYNYSNSEELVGYKEVVNPQPLFRERQPGETAEVGKFDLLMNNQGYYDLKIYGIASGYNGKL